MPRKSFLVYIAYYVSNAAFGLGFLGICITVFFELTGLNRKFGDFRIGEENWEGYSIPVQMNMQRLPDTSKTYASMLANGSNRTFNLYEGEPFMPSQDSLLQACESDTNMRLKSTAVYKWVASHPWGSSETVRAWEGKDDFEVLANVAAQSALDVHVSSVNSTAYVKVKGKTKWQNFMLAIHHYLGMVVYLIISFQLMRLFGRLDRQMGFIDNLHKRVKLIGKVLIYSQIIYFLYVFVFGKFFGSISLHTALSEGACNNALHVNFTPTHEGNLMIFFTGIGLIALSKLFQHGQNLEKEASLTV